ncbi:Protein of unknown function (DUF3037) [Motilibacter peucedani]|uniref:DUF3037 family protein n=1 Tax=Motilibacter peucedani TaxID=598650 RepID=A0A420XMA0_9ACTN|nr:DUF3037 domain-containing protein [Motilibacter peucedani]RKS72410.1 Protein of unknown function (DUF3037) [Motilibacter peucedani]
MRHAYEWVLLRLVPRVERGEFVNVGAVVYSQSAEVLVAAVELDEARALALCPSTDLTAVREHLVAVEALCRGDASTGASGSRPPGERFRWLVAPRSTMVQASPVHTGVAAEPAAELDRLVSSLVRCPPAAGSPS